MRLSVITWQQYREKFGQRIADNALSIAAKAVKARLITPAEWRVGKDWADEAGHSFVHLLEAAMLHCQVFVTDNERILKSRRKWQQRFKIDIMTSGEFVRYVKKPEPA